jgi:hypothetical protein
MAVTQLLARVQSEAITFASKNQQGFDSILSLAFGEQEAYADFDWSPKILELTLQVVDRPDMIPIVSQAFEGERVLNITSPSGTSEYPVYSEVRVNSAIKVSSLATQLIQLPVDAMSNAEATVRALAPYRSLPYHFSDYVVKYSKALQLFYATASRLDQEIVTWWD